MAPIKIDQRGWWRKLLRRLASLVIMATIAFFLVRVLFANWAHIMSYQWRFDPLLLALSFAALAAAQLANVAIWRETILRMGECISFWHALRLYFAASLAKYIPGTVWQYFGWFYLAQREGIGKVAAGTSVVLAQALSVLAGVVLAVAVLGSTLSQATVGQLVPLLVIVTVALILLQPRLIARVLNWGLSHLGRPPVALNLSFRDMAILFLYYLLSYVLWGIALFLFGNSLAAVAWQQFVPFLGVFPAAYALGLIALFAPAGLGVREGVLTYLLSFFVPLPVATVIALMTRPWIMLVEIIGGAAALLGYMRAGHDEQTDGRT